MKKRIFIVHGEGKELYDSMDLEDQMFTRAIERALYNKLEFLEKLHDILWVKETVT